MEWPLVWTIEVVLQKDAENVVKKSTKMKRRKNRRVAALVEYADSIVGRLKHRSLLRTILEDCAPK